MNGHIMNGHTLVIRSTGRSPLTKTENINLTWQMTKIRTFKKIEKKRTMRQGSFYTTTFR